MSLESRQTCLSQLTALRHVATYKPGKPGLTSFSETLALFFIQFLSFRKMKVQDRQNGPSKSFRAYQKKLAGYAPGAKWNIGFLSASVLICGRNTLRTPASQAVSRLAVEWCEDSLYIDLSQFAGHIYFNAKGDSSRSK